MYSCGTSESEIIPATKICDGQTDCSDGDDEDTRLCEGEKSIEMYGLFIVVGYFLLGCTTYFICKL